MCLQFWLLNLRQEDHEFKASLSKYSKKKLKTDKTTPPPKKNKRKKNDIAKFKLCRTFKKHIYHMNYIFIYTEIF